MIKNFIDTICSYTDFVSDDERKILVNSIKCINSKLSNNFKCLYGINVKKDYIKTVYENICLIINIVKKYELKNNIKNDRYIVKKIIENNFFVIIDSALTSFSPTVKNEVSKHLTYLYRKLDEDDIRLSEAVEENNTENIQIVTDAIINILNALELDNIMLLYFDISDNIQFLYNLPKALPINILNLIEEKSLKLSFDKFKSLVECINGINNFFVETGGNKNGIINYKKVNEIIHTMIVTLTSTDISNSISQKVNFPIYLGEQLMLCKMLWNGYVVAPTWNVDVAIGAIRDSVIELAITKFMFFLLSPGDTYINVGANFGYYTALGANLVTSSGKVYTFEANPVMFPILLKTIFYNGSINITNAYNRAVSNSIDEEIDFCFDYQFIGGGSFLVSEENNSDIIKSPFWDKTSISLVTDRDGKFACHGLYNKITTKTITIDHIIKDQDIDLISIDAESSECYILQGAKNSIMNSSNCKIVFEYGTIRYNSGTDDYKTMWKEIFNFLFKNNYTIRKINPNPSYLSDMLSEPYSQSDLIESAEFGDYFASKETH